jgi:2,3-bisphosphoglycerate-dependent phosphoglycerate mutase
MYKIIKGGQSIMNYFDDKYDYDLWINLSMPDIYKLSFQNNKFAGEERT